MLSDILVAEITAIDISNESIIYAEQNYGASNIKYVKSYFISFIKKIVSQHTLQNIENGLNLALNFKYKKRLIVNAHFNELKWNIHHLINWITEKDFESYQNKEFFYEGVDGVTNGTHSEKNPPNSIICISSSSDLKPIKQLFNYLISAWNPEFLEKLGLQFQDILKQLLQT